MIEGPPGGALFLLGFGVSMDLDRPFPPEVKKEVAEVSLLPPPCEFRLKIGVYLFGNDLDLHPPVLSPTLLGLIVGYRF
jgi:hypothetical protein